MLAFHERCETHTELKLEMYKCTHLFQPPIPGDIYLGYLPLAHILELTSEMTMFVQGVPVGYSRYVAKL